MQLNTVGFIGLGNMGSALAQHAIKSNFQVVGYNRTAQKTDQLKQTGFTPTYSLNDFITALKPPRLIWLMLSVGLPIDTILFGPNQLNKAKKTSGQSPENLLKLLTAGDIVIDGANSHYQHTQDRAIKLKQQGIHYLDCGTSGGIAGAKLGASLMIGGDSKAYKLAEPLFKTLAAPNGYGYFGASGSGHFVKMVHNGIEYDMMQAIAEVCAILNTSPLKPDLALATKVWDNGSIIKSNLVKWLNQALTNDANLSKTQATIGSLGTGKWTVETALSLGVPAPVIASAVFARYQTRPEADFGKKIVQALREHFGGHNSQERDAT